MKILSQRCRSFRYLTTTPSAATCVPLAVSDINRPRAFVHCLVLWVGVEESDMSVLLGAAKAIRRIARKTNSETIVVNGFAQLADPTLAASPTEAARTLDSLATNLAKNDWSVHLMPFGWNKTWQAEVIDGEWEQRLTHLSYKTPDRCSAC